MSAIIVKAGSRAALNVLGMPLRFLADARETGSAWSLFEEEIPLGMGPPPHRHDWDEAYYILKGEVDFEIDGQPVKSTAGDFNHIPRNISHAFKGASISPAHVLIFAAPAHASEFFEELNETVRNLPEDLTKIPEIGRKHGIEFVAKAGA